MLVANGQKHHVFNIQVPRSDIPSSLLKDSFYHVCADNSQQDEGHPVVVSTYGQAEAGTQEISEQRHGGLESAEVQPNQKGALPVHFGHGSGPYRQIPQTRPWTAPNGDDKQFS